MGFTKNLKMKKEIKGKKKEVVKDNREDPEEDREDSEDQDSEDQDSEDQEDSENQDSEDQEDSEENQDFEDQENSEEDRESGDLESTNSEAESNIGNSQSEPEGVPLEELSDSEIEGDIIPKQRVTINNKSALRKICNEIKIDAPWIETQSITSSEPVVIKDVHNDVERELAFYKQALEAAVEGREKIITSGVPFSRPDDYFAEMIKSDEHMSKIRKKLIDEEKGIKASEEARRQRELRKFGKKVQVEKIQERQKQKKEELEKIKLLKKKRKGIEENVDDDFEIALDEAAEDDRPKKRQNTGKNKKRLTKDVKFGFGGKKRFSKSNTSETSGDLSGFGASGGKGNFQTKFKKKSMKNRPGKARRQSARNKKR